MLTKWLSICLSSLLSVIYDFLSLKSSIHLFMASYVPLSCCLSVTNSTNHTERSPAQKHVKAAVCVACARHPENDLHPFSGLSFPQLRTPSGLQNVPLFPPPKTAIHAPKMSQGREQHVLDNVFNHHSSLMAIP